MRSHVLERGPVAVPKAHHGEDVAEPVKAIPILRHWR
jgi:hypothetical protein